MPCYTTIDSEVHNYLPHPYESVNRTLLDDAKRLQLKVVNTYRKLTIWIRKTISGLLVQSSIHA